MSADARVVLITGGSRGIGRACASRELAIGSQVIITARDGAAASEVATELVAEHGGEAVGLQFEQNDPMSLSALIREVHSVYKRLDGLVVNAGAHSGSPIGMVSDDEVQRLFSTNSVGVFRTVQAAVKLLRRGERPSVVLVGSVMAGAGVAGQALYSMTKAAVHGLVVPAARELGPLGIRVNAVAPGYVETDMLSSMSESQRVDVVHRTPLGRLAQPEDVADVVSFLLGESSRFVNGQVIGVDGGLVG